jgi:hypothetical protein
VSKVYEIGDRNKEIERIASCPARKEAFEMFAEGRLSDGLKCLTPYPGSVSKPEKVEESQGCWEDERLFTALMNDFFDQKDDERDLSFFDKANQQVDLWGASPLEVALRRGTSETFRRALDEVCSPKRRFEIAGRQLGKGWTSLQIREFAGGTRFFSRSSSFDSLIFLAMLLGKSEEQAMMLGKGWHTLADGGADYLISQTQALISDKPEKTAAWMDVDIERLNEIPSQLVTLMNLEKSLIDACKSARTSQILIRKASEALDNNPPVGSSPLLAATHKNELELLARLFKQGGNPNAVDATGVPVFAAINLKNLSSEALQIWLNAGANPMSCEPKVPFGHREFISALYNWCLHGRLDLISQAIKSEVCPVKFVFEHKGDFYSPPLAAALKRGHVDLAKWLIEEQGCSLDHFGELSGKTCRSYALGKTKAHLTALLEESAMRNKHKAALSTPRPPIGGL